jgi:ribosomal protein S18 acetylase RimI-like enzyme
MHSLPDSQTITFRQNIEPSDPEGVDQVVASSGFFSAEERKVAVELVSESLLRGSELSGYHFLFAEFAGKLVGYTCYGAIPFTESSYDLYWIAVQNRFRGLGLGRQLLTGTERLIAARQGRRVYVETSSREQYQPTHRFYEARGYHLEAILKQFYSPHDDKMIYLKLLDETV